MTPVILAADTTSEFGSLAVLRGGEILEEIAIHAPDGFAHVLYAGLAALLERTGVRLPQVDCFAAAAGPGSFTGVRIGLACMTGLAEAMGKSMTAVSNLEALAAFGTAPRRAAVLDARRGEVYAAVYDGAGRIIEPERVLTLDAWLDGLNGKVQFVTADAGMDLRGAPAVLAPKSLAAAVARIAFARWQRGELDPPEAIDANYVRRSDAELFWKE